MDTSQALCKGQLDLFFDDRPDSVGLAKAICEECALIKECLTGSLKRAEAYGVWGGTDYHERRIIAASLGYPLPSRRSEVPHGTTRGFAWHQREGIPIEMDANGEDVCGCRTAYLADARSRVARYRKRKKASQ
jgi:hypothetical protein